ncbi:Peptidase S1, PA clan,Serine proteases, trypsin domain [Cinara cedri]|uniref:Peptidase S1, PA clan,Serine proteases, trypsin domain n=1 Tax=Cinara cedri TaxID=506608 RepID=A0A5E4MJC1_9HEMI|nr:Peptidase S1, PA clan,Serine proteases, trypsin domain [Cinara cedri]
MNTCFYLMLVHLVSIIYTSNEDIKITATNLSTIQRVRWLSENHSAQKEDLEVNQKNSLKPYFEKTKSMLQRLPSIARGLGRAVVSNLSPDVAPNLHTDVPMRWRIMLNFLTELNNQLQRQKVPSSFKKGVDMYTLKFKFDNELFETKHYEFKAVRDRYIAKHLPIAEEDESDKENINPMLPYWGNITPITTENQFIQRATNKHFFPYHVVIAASIDERDKWCQGALIRSNWIITSRSCLKKHFDVESMKPVRVFLDAINHKSSKSIFYSDVVLSDHITVGPILFEPDPFGLNDLTLLKLVTVPKTTEVPAVALEILANDIEEEVYCFAVTRCSDGVVRGLLYELTDQATEMNLKFMKPGSIIECDNQLLSIKTNGTSFYPLISALNWIDKSIRDGDSDTTFQIDLR